MCILETLFKDNLQKYNNLKKKVTFNIKLNRIIINFEKKIYEIAIAVIKNLKWEVDKKCLLIKVKIKKIIINTWLLKKKFLNEVS